MLSALINVPCHRQVQLLSFLYWEKPILHDKYFPNTKNSYFNSVTGVVYRYQERTTDFTTTCTRQEQLTSADCLEFCLSLNQTKTPVLPLIPCASYLVDPKKLILKKLQCEQCSGPLAAKQIYFTYNPVNFGLLFLSQLNWHKVKDQKDTHKPWVTSQDKAIIMCSLSKTNRNTHNSIMNKSCSGKGYKGIKGELNCRLNRDCDV